MRLVARASPIAHDCLRMALDSAGNAPAESVARAAPPSARFLRDLSRSTDRVTDHLKKHLDAKRENMETMEEDEPVSSSEAPRAPAMDPEEGLSTPAEGCE